MYASQTIFRRKGQNVLKNDMVLPSVVNSEFPAATPLIRCAHSTFTYLGEGLKKIEWTIRTSIPSLIKKKTQIFKAEYSSLHVSNATVSETNAVFYLEKFALMMKRSNNFIKLKTISAPLSNKLKQNTGFNDLPKQIILIRVYLDIVLGVAPISLGI